MLAYRSDERQYISCKRIDNFLNDIRNNAPEKSLFQDYHIEQPISCIAMQKGGERVALGLFNGKIQVYQFKIPKESYKLEFEFSDATLTAQKSMQISANSMSFCKNILGVAWNSLKLGFYDLAFRCECGGTSTKNAVFNFISHSECETYFYYSRRKNNEEKSVIQKNFA